MTSRIKSPRITPAEAAEIEAGLTGRTVPRATPERTLKTHPQPLAAEVVRDLLEALECIRHMSSAIEAVEKIMCNPYTTRYHTEPFHLERENLKALMTLLHEGRDLRYMTIFTEIGIAA